MEYDLDEENVGAITMRSETSNNEPEWEIPPEDPVELKKDESTLVEKTFPNDTELIAAPRSEEAPKQDLGKATVVSQEVMRKEETIEHLGKLEATLFCLQIIILCPLGECVKDITSGRTGEDPKQEIIESETPIVQAEIPSPVTDKQEGCDKKGRHAQGCKRNDKGTTRQIYLRELERWPNVIERKDPSDHSLHPKKKRKIQGTFKNHKKKKVTTLMTYHQRNPWEGGPAEKGLF